MHTTARRGFLVSFLLMGSMTAAAGEATTLDQAELGSVVEPASLVGLECHRAGLSQPMTCVMERMAKDGVDMQMRARLVPMDKKLILDGVEMELSLPGGADPQKVSELAAEARSSVVKTLQGQGYSIASVNARNEVVLTGKVEVICRGRGTPGRVADRAGPASRAVVHAECRIHREETDEGSTFAYEGWIDTGIPVLTVARTRDFSFATEPGGGEAFSCTLQAGQRVSFKHSVVRTDRAGRIQLEAPFRLPEETLWYGPTTHLSAKAAHRSGHRTLLAEMTVEHLAPRAEGSCYYRANDEVLLTSCFHGQGQSADTSWWIEASCGGQDGWVQVKAGDFEVQRQF